MKYKISQYAKKKGVTTRTVWNWIADGRLAVERSATNRVLVVEDDSDAAGAVAIYVRVASQDNDGGLDAQVERLESYCAARGYRVAKVVREIGSLASGGRPMLDELVADPDVKTVVVDCPDRVSLLDAGCIRKLMEAQGKLLEVFNECKTGDDLREDEALSDQLARYGLSAAPCDKMNREEI